jgi:hypothetical protein
MEWEDLTPELAFNLTIEYDENFTGKISRYIVMRKVYHPAS